MIERVWVVRHGQVADNIVAPETPLTASEYNAMIHASDHSVLTEEGRRQVEEAARVFRGRPIPAVHSSPLARALESAEILSGRLDLPVVTVPGMREMIPSEMRDGFRPYRRRALRSWFLRSMLRQFLPIPGDGEKAWAARRRVRTAWLEFLHAPFEATQNERLLVAHRGTIMLLAGILRTSRGWRMVRTDLRNAGITEILRV